MVDSSTIGTESGDIRLNSGGEEVHSNADTLPHQEVPSVEELLCLTKGGGRLSLSDANLTSLLTDLSKYMGNHANSLLPPEALDHLSIPDEHKFTTGSYDGVSQSSKVACRTEWDKLVCWPETPEGQMATLPCFGELNNIFYDTSRNATRYCLEGGIWTKSDYSECRVLNGSVPHKGDDHLAITTGIYFFGYCVSLCALVIAIIIFLAFKELRCLRNKIHTHLMITYVLADTLWIITSSTTFTSSGSGGGGVAGNPGGNTSSGLGDDDENGYENHTDGLESVGGSLNIPGGGSGQTNQVPCITFILLHYFHLTNFFWMFVEGLYLYVLVVKTFVSENIKLRVYACVGWGVPLTVVIAWSIAKWITQSDSAESQITDSEFSASTCLWLHVNEYDWIYKTPVILVLAANLIFLLQIMWVLITKLRSAMNPETQQSIKAAKALIVLMPLLGITYVLILSGSKEPVYEYLRVLLISTQGFLVALLYCFLNGEVRQAIRHRWNRLRTMGPICCDFERRRHQMHHMTKDWSPRSRTESIRYACPRQHDMRKRDSVISNETTTVTTINSGFGSAGSGSSGHGLGFFNGSSAASGGGNSSSSSSPQPTSSTPLQLQQSNQQVPFSVTRGLLERGGGNGISQFWNEQQRIKPKEYRVSATTNGVISTNSKQPLSNGFGTRGNPTPLTVISEQSHLMPNDDAAC